MCACLTHHSTLSGLSRWPLLESRLSGARSSPPPASLQRRSPRRCTLRGRPCPLLVREGQRRKGRTSRRRVDRARLREWRAPALGRLLGVRTPSLNLLVGEGWRKGELRKLVHGYCGIACFIAIYCEQLCSSWESNTSYEWCDIYVGKGSCYLKKTYIVPGVHEPFKMGRSD